MKAVVVHPQDRIPGDAPILRRSHRDPGLIPA
jgi:hypothetical protein